MGDERQADLASARRRLQGDARLERAADTPARGRAGIHEDPAHRANGAPIASTLGAEVYAESRAGTSQFQLVPQRIACVADEAPGTHRIAGPGGEHLTRPIEALGVETILVLVAEVATLVIDLRRERPGAKRGGAVQADNPVVADERVLTVRKAETRIHLGADPQRNRPCPSAQRQHRKVLPQCHLRLGLVAEAALALSHRDDAAGDTVHAGGRLRSLEAGNVREDAGLGGRRSWQAENEGESEPESAHAA
jgi:hypothetical protein